MSPDQKPGRTTPKKSLRYTPPQKGGKGPSPTVVPVMMLVCFGLGCIIIILNYFEGAPLLPGETSNRNLLLGLGFITAGFIISTKWR